MRRLSWVGDLTFCEVQVDMGTRLRGCDKKDGVTERKQELVGTSTRLRGCDMRRV